MFLEQARDVPTQRPILILGATFQPRLEACVHDYVRASCYATYTLGIIFAGVSLAIASNFPWSPALAVAISLRTCSSLRQWSS